MNARAIAAIPPSSIEMDPSLEIELYLSNLIEQIQTIAPSEVSSGPATPEQVFNILTSRQFSYLGRTQSTVYREAILRDVEIAMVKKEPIRFYYDIGGGYHAVPQQDGTLVFAVGLAELFILFQISLFAHAVRSIYGPGVEFFLVVDNLCAFFSNDIPLEKTTAYCQKLRSLIDHLGLAQRIKVLVESEHTSIKEFSHRLNTQIADSYVQELTEQQHNNVERFIGRSCTKPEAAERSARYKRVSTVTEYFLTPLARGIRMTQRATPGTICFRSFPGGNSRIQCGEVVLRRNAKDQLIPALMTNVKDYYCRDFQFPKILPPMISYITFVEALSSCHGSNLGYSDTSSLITPWSTI